MGVLRLTAHPRADGLDMNTPVGPGGAGRRRRSDPACSFVLADWLVYAVAVVVVVADFLH